MKSERRYKLPELDEATTRRILFDLREGDTLAEISRRYRIPLDVIETLARANGRPKLVRGPKPKSSTEGTKNK